MGILDLFHKKPQEPEPPAIPEPLEKLGFPCQPLPDMPPEALVQCFREALAQGRREGFTPVIVPDDEILFECMEDLAAERSLTEACEKSAEMDGRQLLAERRLEAFDCDGDEEMLEDLRRPEVLPDASPAMQTFYASELRKEKMRLFLVQVPTEKPWEAVLYLPFGGWNDCPDPEEMAAILRYWHEQWGAVPAVITHDVLEMLLPAPVPEDKAWDVAEEHYAFTTDIVWQGTGSLATLADCLRKSDIWFFWWD